MSEFDRKTGFQGVNPAGMTLLERALAQQPDTARLQAQLDRIEAKLDRLLADRTL